MQNALVGDNQFYAALLTCLNKITINLVIVLYHFSQSAFCTRTSFHTFTKLQANLPGNKQSICKRKIYDFNLDPSQIYIPKYIIHLDWRFILEFCIANCFFFIKFSFFCRWSQTLTTHRSTMAQTIRIFTTIHQSKRKISRKSLSTLKFARW